MSKTISSKIVKIRKKHNCFGCGREFPVGSFMQKDFVVDDIAFTCYLCETCQEVCKSLDWWDEFGYGELRDEALELEKRNESKSNTS